MKTTTLILLLLLATVGHAEVAMQNPVWTASGSLELAVAQGDLTKAPYVTLKIDHLELGKTETVTRGPVTAVVRALEGAANERSVMTIAITVEGYASKAGVPLVAVFVAEKGSDQRYTLVNTTPILNSAAMLSDNLRTYTRGLIKFSGCTEVGALRLLGEYAKQLPGRMVRAAATDVEADNFGKATGELCAELPVPERVIDPTAPPKAPVAPAAPAAPKKKSRDVITPDGRRFDADTGLEIAPTPRRAKTPAAPTYDDPRATRQDPYGRRQSPYDEPGGYGQQRGYDQQGYGQRGYGSQY